MAQMIINGEHVGAASGATMDIRNPATGEVVDSVPKADAEASFVVSGMYMDKSIMGC